MRIPVALLLPVLLVLTSSIGYRQQANAFSAQAPKKKQNSAMTPPPSETATEAGRRAFLRTAGATIAATTSSVLISTPSPALAAATGTEVQLETLEDAGNGFSIKVPKSWTASTQSLPDRRKMKLYIDPSTSEKDDKTLLFLAYTPVRDDFTSLGSFGSVDEVAQATILPKGEMMGESTTSKLLSAESKKNAYFFDYTAKVPGQPERHFRTIFTLAQGATGGAGANLVTITAQSPESRYSDVKSTFDAIIDSYGKFTGN
mmetsp:Transcript_18906/g.41195  ORF Transcript_18906/g.41195 Transcript_18906/m.41195 type:complete len:259 (-) Transcript_18906:116-892(-)